MDFRKIPISMMYNIMIASPILKKMFLNHDHVPLLLAIDYVCLYVSQG